MSWTVIFMFLITTKVYGTAFKISRNGHESSDDNFAHPTNNETLLKVKENTCKTKACENESALIKTWLKESIDPCDNFYEFACGNVEFISGLRSRAYSQVSLKTQNQMTQILSEPLHSNDVKAIRLPKIFYQSCVSRSAWNQSGNIKQLKNYQQALFCNYHVLKSLTQR